MTTKQRFASVWDAIEDTPQEAASLRARSALMIGWGGVAGNTAIAMDDHFAAPCTV